MTGEASTSPDVMAWNCFCSYVMMGSKLRLLPSSSVQRLDFSGREVTCDEDHREECVAILFASTEMAFRLQEIVISSTICRTSESGIDVVFDLFTSF